MTGYAAQMAADTQFVGTPAISFLLGLLKRKNTEEVTR